MTPLEALIRQEITQTGPMSVARYMELCLTHPEHGYYTTQDPLGQAGDFTTAPEISQMFGEMIGAWVASAWDLMGRPDFKFVEHGPGRGTLMADALRVLAAAGAAPEVWFVEVSSAFREAQAMAVPEAKFADALAAVPDGPSIFIANEFLDALPVRQYLSNGEAWHERVIGVDQDRLIWGLAPSNTGSEPGIEGDWREVSRASTMVLAEIAHRLKNGSAAALIIDYGYTAADRPKGPTLQALNDHAYADPLEAPGQSDLTWLIDFDDVRQIFSRSDCPVAVTTQGTFLAQLGIGHRAQALAERSPDQADTIADALERLTGPDQMGTLFKVLGAVSPRLSLPPGFETAL